MANGCREYSRGQEGGHIGFHGNMGNYRCKNWEYYCSLLNSCMSDEKGKKLLSVHGYAET